MTMFNTLRKYQYLTRGSYQHLEIRKSLYRTEILVGKWNNFASSGMRALRLSIRRDI